MCNTCNERESSNSRDVSVDDLKRSRSPLGPHRSKLVIICLTFQLLLRTYGGVGRWDQRKRVTSNNIDRCEAAAVVLQWNASLVRSSREMW